MSIYKAVKKFLNEQKIKKMLKTSKIGATTDLVLFNIKRNNKSLQIYEDLKNEFLKSSNHIRGGVGERYINVVVAENYHDYVLNLFKEHVLSVQKNTSCIIINCEGTENVSGVITYITSKLASKKINMYSFFTSKDDLIVIIDENRAYEYVNELKKELNA